MKTRDASYGIVLLAAGASSRLGRPKQLLNFQGESLLKRAVKTALQVKAGARVIVLGAGAGLLTEEIRPLINETRPPARPPADEAHTPAEGGKEHRAAIALNRQFREGIASSIRCGVRYIADHYQADHLILMLCDQPYINAGHLRALIDKHKESGSKIVASLYANSKGVPALFDKTVVPELLELEGDAGAKKLIEKYEAFAIPFSPAAIDIDTEEAYQALVNSRF